ncbi:MAG: hypothetical protein HN929_03850, partial [Chloroflexi bacterium]|nr:hypothetical protein [Chloroflexota bacterium]
MKSSVFVKRLPPVLRIVFLLLFLGLQAGLPVNGILDSAQAEALTDSLESPVHGPEAAPAFITVPAEMNKSFTPIAITSGGISKLRVTVYNLNGNPLTSATWTDNFPAGITVADPPNITHTCDGSGTAIITDGADGALEAGDTSLKLANGEVPAQAPSGVPGDCYVEVDVTSFTVGNLVNTIPAGNLSSLTEDPDSPGSSVPISNTTPASATLNVIGVEDPSLSKTFAPNTIWVGDTSVLSITIHNNDLASPLTHATVTDILPSNGDGDIRLTSPLNFSLSGCGEGAGATLTDSSGGALAIGSTSVKLNNGIIQPNSDCVISVDVTSAVQGNYTNTIPDGNPFNPGAIETQEGATNQDPASAPLNVQAFSIAKAFATSPIAVGQSSELTITIENHAPFDYTDAALDDVLPTGFKFIDPPAPSTSSCTGTLNIVTTTNTDDTLRFTNGTLPANTVCTITASVRALISTSVGTYTNTIPINALTTDDGATNHTTASDNIAVQSLSISKDFTETEVALGGTSLLTLIISNPSPFDFTNASLDDILPTGLEYLTGTGSTTCLSGSVGLTSTTMSLTGATIPNGSIASPGTCTVTSTVRASASEPPANHTNTIPAGAITTDEGGTNASPTSDSINVTGIEIAKAFSPSTFAAGTETTLTITIINPAPIDFTGATLSDTLPVMPNDELYFTGTPTTTCTSGSETVTLSGVPATRTVTLANGTLPASSSCTITATVTTNADAPDASYSGANANVIPANELVTTQGASNSEEARAPVFVETISVDKEYDVSSAISYPDIAELTITITSPETANAITGLTLTDDLPAGLIIATPANASTTCNDSSIPTLTADPNTTTISIIDGSLPAALTGDVSCEIVVDVTVEREASSGTYTNTIGEGAIGTSDPNGPTNTFEESVGLGVEAVSIDKSFQYAGFEAGTTNTLTVTLTNPTTETYVNAAFDDILPTAPNSNLFYTGIPATTCSAGSVSIETTNYTDDTLRLTGATIPAGTQGGPAGTCTVTVDITTLITASGASYTNRISVDGLTTEITPSVTGPTNKTEATDPVYVYDDEAGIVANKSFSPDTIDIFGTSRLTLTFTAPPDTDLTNFTFTDILPTAGDGDVVLEDPINASISNGCGVGAELTDASGTTGSLGPDDTTIKLIGGTILKDETCTVAIDVTSNNGTTNGTIYTNTIEPDDVDNDEERHPAADISADLTVETPSTLTIDKAFYPTIVGPDGRSTLTITLENEGTTALVDVTLDDFLPGIADDGLVVASIPNASTTCTDGVTPPVLTTGSGTQTINMTGGYIPAQVNGINGICTIVVNVEGKYTSEPLPNTYTNTIDETDVVARIENIPATMNPKDATSANLIIKDLDLEVVKGFDPQLVYGGADSVMSIILRNPNQSAELLDITFTDYMPVDSPGPGAMILIDPPNFDATDCGPNAELTKIDSSTFKLTGGYLAAGDECTLTLNATMTVNGNRTNTIPIAEVTSSNGAYNHTPTSATLTNLAGASISKSFAPNPIAAGLGSYSILTIEIRTTASVHISGLGLVDTLPAGLEVAGGSAPAPTNSCGGTFSPSAGDTSVQLTDGVLGIGFSNCFLTVPVTGAEPGDYRNLIASGELENDQDVTNLLETEDTLTLTPYSLGNRVWYDTDNDGNLDVGELGVEDVRVELYKDDGATPGVYDTGDTYQSFETTDADGYYRFDDLGAGDYVVVVSSDNFRDVGGGDNVATDPLKGYVSSGTEINASGAITDTINTDPDDDADNDDNGVTTPIVTGGLDYVSAKTVTLGPDYVEPLAEADPTTNPETGEATDNQSNRTVDFGFYKQELGNLIFLDEVIDGVYDSGDDSPIENATVQLFTPGPDGLPNTADDVEVLVGPDGIGGTTDDATGGMLTDVNGNYLFSGLPEGEYIVKVDLPGYRSTIDTNPSNTPADVTDPDENIDDNDNGVGQDEGTVSAGDAVTLTPNDIGTNSNNIITNSTATTQNPTLDFGYVLPRSLGNRLWIDDGGTTGIANNGIMDGDEAPVVGARVSLYEDDTTDGAPDGAALRWDTTDAGGYYLFDGLFPGNYLVGVDTINFQTGQVLDGYASSVGNAPNDTDSNDNGIDRIQPNDATASPYGILSNTIDLSAVTPSTPTGETDLSSDTTDAGLSNNPTAWDGTDSRGRYGEADAGSDLTIDFGFFKPMSIGNRVFYDNGGTTGTLDNGIMDGDEAPVASVRVELYQDTDGTPGLQPATDAMLYFDTTDASGYYLFDQLAAGEYYVHIPSSNFTGSGVLRGWYNSNVDFSNDVDSNDNGVKNHHPNINGITSNLLTLAEDTEPAGETELSGDTTPNGDTYDPTAWDGPDSRGRWNESDDNSNLTIDFGFIPPLSLGNRVWIDEGAIAATPGVDLTQFNDGVMNGTEAGIANVVLNLYYDANGNGIYDAIIDGVDEADIYRTTTTDASGYYLFDGLPEGVFYVEVDSANFNTGNALDGYQSSEDQPAFNDEATDLNDNGEDDIAYLTNGIRSREFDLDYDAEPISETDLPANTAANQTAYGPNLRGRYGEEDASSNLTFDFGFVKTHSIGNRVWRDSDNSGTINALDDVNPGIAGVTVNLYEGTDSNSDGIPDDLLTVLATTTTDSDGYYLFGNLPAGNYIIGIPASNFVANTDALYLLRSSTGEPPIDDEYEIPVDGNADSADHGIDPLSQGLAVYSPIIPLGEDEETGESDLSSDTGTYGPNSRGVNNEPDDYSDLTVDFGFFGGSDIPFSIGNHLWKDDGLDASNNPAGSINDGLRDANEKPVIGARVELYRDADGDGPEGQEFFRYDITDANGFYLFDNLDPGNYYVKVPADNFGDVGAGDTVPSDPLIGWHSSTSPDPANVEAGIDQNDDGVDSPMPDIYGIWSTVITLVRNTDEPIGETHLSSDTTQTTGFSPTGGDGDGSLNGADPAGIGRFGEIDQTSNVTVDFGFIPPLSIGNRVWIDDGSGEASFGTGYNNGIMDGTETGVNGVDVELLKGGSVLRTTTTAEGGYYLFELLKPDTDYSIRIAASNFQSGGALEYYKSSSGAPSSSPYDQTDVDDNGIDDSARTTNGITSHPFEMAYDTEPETVLSEETDINNSGTYGPDNVGNYGQDDNDSNLTLDFGFYRPRSIGNQVWFDTDNDRIFDNAEQPVTGGLRVSLYLDENTDGVPDDVDGNSTFDHNDALRWDTTDANGFYLFDNLPPRNYLVGIDSTNFQTGGDLVGYFSSTGNRSDLQNNNDSRDVGRDNDNPNDPTLAPHGILSTTINMTGESPTGESSPHLSSDTGTTAGDDPTEDDGPNSRGRYGETDESSNLTIDFGFYKTEIGNLVFFDANADGTYLGADGDTVLANVLVQLYESDGTTEIITGADGILNTDDDSWGPDGVDNSGANDDGNGGIYTDASGLYLFSGLPEENYVVKVTTPADMVSTIDSYDQNDNDAPDDEVDNNDNGDGIGYDTRTDVSSNVLFMDAGESDDGDTLTVSLAAGTTTDTGLDFGFTYAYAIGNRVWYDTDNSSAIDNGEGLDGATKIGIDGVRVELYAADASGDPTGTILAFDTTANGGYYLFDYLTADEYVVVIPTSQFADGAVLEGYKSSATVMDSDGTMSETAITGLTDDDTDSDDNGTLQSGDVVSVGISLGTAIDSEPAGETDLNSGSQGDQDDDRANMTVDFGFYKTEIGNIAFVDVNQDGTYLLADDTLLDGVTIRLYNADGTVEIEVGPDGILGTSDDTTGRVSTGDAGNSWGTGIYLFSGLPEGDYVVRAGGVTNYTSTIDSYDQDDNDDPDDNIDNNDNGVGILIGAVDSATLTIIAAETTPAGGDGIAVDNNTGNTTDSTVDFGFIEAVAIGNRVWFDIGTGTGGVANDGIQNGTEAGVNSVLVELYDGNDNFIDDTTTDTNGNYLFDQLPAGEYYILIPASEFGSGEALEGYLSSTNNGGDDTNDQNVDENGIDNDAPATNGIRTPVYDLQPNDEPDATDVETEYAGTLDDDNVNFTADLGFLEYVAIGNRVWFDTGSGAGEYNNGEFDAGETPVSGITVNLYTSIGTWLDSDTTDSNGHYEFDKLEPGSYYVQIPTTEFDDGGDPLFGYVSSTGAGTDEVTDEATGSGGDENGADANPTIAGIRTNAFTLAPDGETTVDDETLYEGVLDDDNVNFTADFGFVTLGAIGNRVWLDVGGSGGEIADNGIQETGELGINDVTVELYLSGATPGTDAPLRTTTTSTLNGEAGSYQFDQLNPGSYFVHIPASEFQSTGDLAGNTSSSGYGAINNDDDHNADENGIDSDTLPADGISSPVYTLEIGLEPTVDDQTSYTGYLANANVNFTADFGFLQKVAIGNIVWLDNGDGVGTANNGQMDGSEAGIEDVTVQLYDAGPDESIGGGDDVLLTQVDTDADGYYNFDNLLPGFYYLHIPAAEFGASAELENLRSSAGWGTNETSNEDADENGIDAADIATLIANGISSTVYELTLDGEETGEDQSNYTGALDDDNVNFTADFGFTELVAIGNRVWLDTGSNTDYNDGEFDAGESGINGVTINLYTSAGSFVATTTTANHSSTPGYYEFDNLMPGEYYVQIPASEFQSGGDLLGYVSTTTTGSNETTDEGSDENGIDADAATNGIQTQTYDLQPNTEQTSEAQDNYSGALDDNNVNFTADLSFVKLVALGNRAWFDTGTGDGTADDGIQHADELGVNGVTIQLFNSGDDPASDTPVTAQITNGSGDYYFDMLNPGSYFVHIPASQFAASAPLEGYVSSTGNGGVDDDDDQSLDENGIDENALPTNGISTPVYTLAADSEPTSDVDTGYTGYLDDNNVNLTADFGFLQKVAIGNRVWLDNGDGSGGVANNGQMDGSEVGIDGVTIELYDAGTDGTVGGGDDIYKTQVATSGGGYYNFDNLLPGKYYLHIPSAEFRSGGQLINLLSSTDSTAKNETSNETVDENGLDNATPEAVTGGGITSNVFDLQPNTEQTSEPQTNYSGALDDNNVNFTADFGFTELVAIGDRVWFDTGSGVGEYNNGILDAGESTQNGVTVQLYTSGGILVTSTTTSGGGFYEFDGLLPGQYYVQIPATDFQSSGPLEGYVSTTTTGSDETTDNDSDENGIDADAVTNGIRTQDYNLQPNTETTADNESNYTGDLDDDNVNFTADMSFVKLVAIGNRVWFDTGTGAGTADDGIQHADELGVNDVEVQLFNSGDDSASDSPLATTTTATLNAQVGSYQFDQLNPGSYFVHIPSTEFNDAGDPLYGYISSANNGGDDTNDQNADENGIDESTLATNGISTSVYALAPDLEPATDVDTAYTGYLDDDNVNLTADFGFLQKVAIGNRIWIDDGAGAGTANNGQMDGSEAGINGITVNLYTSAGVLIDTTTTADYSSEPGYYEFDMLPPGQYYIQIPASEFDEVTDLLYDYVSTTTTGSDEATDEGSDENGIDANPTVAGIRTNIFNLQPNNEETSEAQDNYSGYLDDDNVNFTADLSFVKLVALGNRIWFDTGAVGGIADNGIQDGGETGVSGVQVDLYLSDGTFVKSTTTNISGDYYFDLLTEDDYYVEIPSTEFDDSGDPLYGYVSTTGNGGVDDDDDQTADENGVDENALATNGIRTPNYTLSVDSEPTADVDTGYTGYLDDNNVNLTADLSFLQKVAIGNRVWYDTGTGGGVANNGILDGVELGADNVTVELYGFGPDGFAGTADDTSEGSVVTSGGGYYLFDNLLPGGYYLHIPSAEFNGSEALAGYLSSTDVTV